MPELYTHNQDGCHEYCSLRYVVGTMDGTNIGDDYEQHFSVKTIGNGEETIVKLDHWPLQQKVQQVLQSSDKDSLQEKAKKMGMFQWILRIAGISFVLLCILLLLVILSIPAQQGKSQNEFKRENIYFGNNVVSFVNTKFKAPATDLKIGIALKENMRHSRSYRRRISAL